MYKSIVVPVDINDDSSWTKVLPEAFELANAYSAELYIMNVIPDYGISMLQEYFPKGWIEDLITKSEDALGKIVKDYAKEGVKYTISVGRGAVYQAILDLSEATQADLIMLSSNSLKSVEYLLGPNAAKVVRHAKISVLVVR